MGSNLLFLRATAFCTGMSIMGLEMLASRFLAPFFGTSTYIWATIIGMAMIALSLGYLLGGRWADRNPKPSGLYRTIFVAACLTFVIPLGRIVPRIGHQGALQLSWTTFIAGLFGSLALFFLPMMLLATASPYLIRLGARTVGTVGSTSGDIYAISTVGSIVGVFLTTFVGMPYLGVVETLLAYGFLLLGVSVLGLRSPRLLAAGVLLFLLSAFGPVHFREKAVVFEGESAYNYVKVIRSDDGALLLKLNEGIGSQSVYYESDIYTGGIWDYFLAPLLYRPEARKVLIIGFAGGTVARQYLALSNATIIGVEIDPLVVRVSKRYFGVRESGRLQVLVADGRTYLSLCRDKFDIVLMDAFNPPTIPFHLATREFFELVRDRLNPGGLFAINVPRYGDAAHVVDPVCATLESVFGRAFLIDRRPDIPQLAVAASGDLDLEDFTSKVRSNALGAPGWLVNGIADRTVEFDGRRDLILTDDRSPIEMLVHRIVFDYVRSPASEVQEAIRG